MNTDERERQSNKQPLPNFYVCIAPDEKELVIEFLRSATHERGRIHLQLCLHCREFVEVAATQMHDLCVQKVKAIRDEREKEGLAVGDDDYEYAAALGCAVKALDEALKAIEPLTLDQVKEKQS